MFFNGHIYPEESLKQKTPVAEGHPVAVRPLNCTRHRDLKRWAEGRRSPDQAKPSQTKPVQARKRGKVLPGTKKARKY